jgi:citrate synthase
MSEKQSSEKTSKRRDKFTDKPSTRICKEIPSQENPYVAQQVLCYGYDLLELAQKRSYTDTVYMLLRGELPNKAQSELMETLFVALTTPGPRHPATRAAMNAGVGKTYPEHILPIGLSVLGGSYLGAIEVADSMNFLKKNQKYDPSEVAVNLLSTCEIQNTGDCHIAPGFGSRFNSIDIMPTKLANTLLQLDSGDYLNWGSSFSNSIAKSNMGWLMTGVSAAVFLDLGFHPRAGLGLFQLACAPGLLAQGLELVNKPSTAMPFIDDEHYSIESTNEKD